MRKIRPTVQAVRSKTGDLLVNSIKSNIDHVTGEISEKAQLGSLTPDVRVVEAYYDFDTGEVEWLDRAK